VSHHPYFIITSDNIHVTVRPADGLQLPKDPVERQKVLDAAYQSKSDDDQKAYGKTTAQVQQDALKGNAKASVLR
jgi:hypothetical protein